MISQGAPTRRGGAETGFTLVEAVIAIAIFGLAVAAILGALFTLVKSSTLHRTQAQANAVLSSAAAAIVDPTRNPYSGSCSPSLPTYDPTMGVTLPNGWTNANVTAAVTGYNGSGTCSGNAVQTVTITVAMPSGGGTWTLDAVKRP